MSEVKPNLTLMYPWNVKLSSEGDKIDINYANGPFITGQEALDELSSIGFPADFISKVKLAAIGACLIEGCREMLIITCTPIRKPDFIPNVSCLAVTYARIAYYASCDLVECEPADQCQETAYIKDIKKWLYQADQAQA